MRGKTRTQLGTTENLPARLDRIDDLMFDDPGKALPMAKAVVEDYPESARAWATLGAAYRRTAAFEQSGKAFANAEKLPASPFEKAQTHCWHSLLLSDTSRWDEALAVIDKAESLHKNGDLQGPVDRGLPAIVVTRGFILWSAALAGNDCGDLLEAGRCYRRALKMLGDSPLDVSPKVFLIATQGTGIVALHSGHLTKANAALKAATESVDEQWLMETVAGAKLQWLEAVVGAEIFGFADQWRRELERAEKIMYKHGALLDSVLAGFDHILYLLEGSSAPWKEIEHRLSFYHDILDSAETPRNVMAALVFFISRIHRRAVDAEDLSYIYSAIGNTLRKPEARHAKVASADDAGDILGSVLGHALGEVEKRFPDLTFADLALHMREFMLSKKAKMKRELSSSREQSALKNA